MPKSGSTHSYHVVLANGTERDVKATDANVHDGALMLLNNDGPVVMYAAGTWSLCELERKDDRG